jgi:hypothetical protein
MKCADVIIHTSSVSSVFASRATVNHAGVLGSKNESFHSARPRVVVRPSR